MFLDHLRSHSPRHARRDRGRVALSPAPRRAGRRRRAARASAARPGRGSPRRATCARSSSTSRRRTSPRRRASSTSRSRARRHRAEAVAHPPCQHRAGPRLAHERGQDHARAHAARARRRRSARRAARHRPRRGLHADRDARGRRAAPVGHAGIRRLRAAREAAAHRRQPHRVDAARGVGPLRQPAALVQPAGGARGARFRRRGALRRRTPPRTRAMPATSRPRCRSSRWIGKPVLLLLNQVGPAATRRPRRRAEEERWRACVAPFPVVRDVLTLDAFARCWVQEDALFGRVAELIAPDKRAGVRPAGRRLARAQRRALRAVDGRARTADHGRGARPRDDRAVRAARPRAARAARARLRRATRPTARASRPWRGSPSAPTSTIRAVDRSADRPARPRGGGGGDRARAPARALRDHRAGERGQGRRHGRRRLRRAGRTGGRPRRRRAHPRRGAHRRRDRRRAGRRGHRARPQPGSPASDASSVAWSPAFLDGLVRSALLRYLAVAHFGRGRGAYAEAEAPAFWKDEVARAFEARRPSFEALWENARGCGRPGPGRGRPANDARGHGRGTPRPALSPKRATSGTSLLVRRGPASTEPSQQEVCHARRSVRFPGSLGTELAARLDMPALPPRAYALFAHCFTCSKESKAASFVSAALAEHGVAVLRFDFTGLGAKRRRLRRDRLQLERGGPRGGRRLAARQSRGAGDPRRPQPGGRRRARGRLAHPRVPGRGHDRRALRARAREGAPQVVGGGDRREGRGRGGPGREELPHQARVPRRPRRAAAEGRHRGASPRAPRDALAPR